jgi:glyceraldehyde-3-phosphate dehydrogenase (NADP+)
MNKSDHKKFEKIGNYINGAWTQKGSGDFLEVLDKYSQESLATLPMATESDVENAIVSAVKGFKELKSWSAGKRSEFLQKLWTALNNRSEEIVDIIVKEAGKPHSYAVSEVKRCLATIENAVSEAKRFTGEVVPIDYDAGAGKTAFTKRLPIGPVLCITPFNFPLNLVLHKVAPALAAGCSVIVKPAPQAPLSSLFLADLLDEVGYPAGVANFVNCSIPLAEKMVRDDRLAMVSFTGSEKVGWYIKSISGMKKVALELGGNAAVIIDENIEAKTNLEEIAKSVANGAYLYAGQICISTQRILVHEKVFTEFQNLLIKEIEKLNVGDPNDTKTIVGPLIDKQHLDRIATWVKEATDMGAKVLSGGNLANDKANIYQPTLLTQTKSPMKVVDEEAFGPLAVIESFKNFDEAIEKANDSKFGLQVGVYTNNFSNVKKSHELLEVGGVIINSIPGFRIDSMPYGGVKMSGLGREGVKYAMEEMTEPRLIVY